MISDSAVTLHDPVWNPPSRPGLFARTFGGLVRDERDLPFVRLTLLLLGIFVPAAIFLFVVEPFSWWFALLYWTAYLWFMGPFVLMLHNTSHRPLYKRPWHHLNKVIPWVVGPFFGQSPESYAAHHLGMHHIDDNLPSDLSSTMRFQRDSFRDFCKYFFRFLFIGVFELHAYLRQRGRNKLARRLVIGETAYFAVMGAFFVVNWRAAVVVFLVPLVVTRFLLMVGNWAQHAFIDPDEPTNDYKTVVTFINSTYNRRCFNDGYHLGHHLKASGHWTDMPGDFLQRRQTMAEQGSLVFHTVDYFQIFLLLMFGRYERLARYHVNLDPAAPLSSADVVALIKRRVKRFDAGQLAGLSAPGGAAVTGQ